MQERFTLFSIGYLKKHEEEYSIIEILSKYEMACNGLREGMYIIVLCWFHMCDDKENRSLLMVHPMGDTKQPLKGVFATRSNSRPNPIGHYTVKIHKIEGNKIYIEKIDAYEGTPIIDIKPFLRQLDCPSSES